MESDAVFLHLGLVFLRISTAKIGHELAIYTAVCVHLNADRPARGVRAVIGWPVGRFHHVSSVSRGFSVLAESLLNSISRYLNHEVKSSLEIDNKQLSIQ